MDDLLWAYLMENPDVKLKVHYRADCGCWSFSIPYQGRRLTSQAESRELAIRSLLKWIKYID